MTALATTPGAGQTLEGRVIEAGTAKPIPGAALTLLDKNGKLVSTALAGDSGAFRLQAPAAADYGLRVEHIAFAGATLGPVRVHSSGVVTVTVRMDARAIPVDALTVEVDRHVQKLESVGFYERRARGLGQFMERTDIEAQHLRSASDILRRMGGFRILANGSTTDVVSRGSCRPVVYLDGVAVSNRTRYGRAFDLEDLSARDVEGLEVYSGSSSSPPQYSLVDNRCGVILFWTTKPGR